LQQNRLSDVKPRRRSGEVHFLSSGNEVTEVAQFHIPNQS
jgi:hypothetical protein